MSSNLDHVNILWVELYFKDRLYNNESKYLSTAAEYPLLYVKVILIFQAHGLQLA